MIKRWPFLIAVVVSGLAVSNVLAASYDSTLLEDDERVHFDACQEFDAQSCTELLTLLAMRCDGKDFRACGRLGALYATGAGVAQSFERAILVYRNACAAGDPRSCVNLGRRYVDGEGVSVDYREASKLFAKGCELGEPWGCRRLASLHAGGLGMLQDYIEALRLREQACRLKDSDACIMVGNAYLRGEGSAIDFALAHAYYNIAAVLGHSEAVSARIRVESKMKPETVVRAQQYAKNWCQENGC